MCDMYCRRAFRRLDFHAPAFLLDGTRTVFGEVVNLSNHGMYLRTMAIFTQKSPVEVTVYLNGDAATASITIPATVIRTDAKGAGIYSPSISVVSFLELQTLLTSIHGSDDNLFSEFYSMTEIASRSLPPIPRYH
ncbi:MAG: hypothetical protein Fur0034_20300 [Desulfuromonadia bacterium]